MSNTPTIIPVTPAIALPMTMPVREAPAPTGSENTREEKKVENQEYLDEAPAEEEENEKKDDEDPKK